MFYLRLFILIAVLLFFYTPLKVIAGEYVNFIGMQFVDIPVGSFFMGSCNRKQVASSQIACPSRKFFAKSRYPVPQDETPRHKVRLTRHIQFGVHEVTIEQFDKFLRSGDVISDKSDYVFRMTNSYENNQIHLPVRFVSWNDTQRFIKWLNVKKPADDRGYYRLPTEAEWEYAARAGSETTFFFGNDRDRLQTFAWYSDNCWKKKVLTPHKPGKLQANPWGIFDLYGNVGEWVQDTYDASFYWNSGNENPVNEQKGVLRVVRGGAWNYDYIYCRSSARSTYPGSQKSSFIGFRLIRELLLE